jgi:hypothetical protein
MMTRVDNSSFPAWCPDWLKRLVEEPDCSSGTHPTLRRLAKWLVVYMPADECPGLALQWLRVAASKCDRVPDDAELKRLIAWATARAGAPLEPGGCPNSQTVIEIDRLYEIIIAGPTRDDFREMSPECCWDSKQRNTARILDAWGRYAGEPNPWVCHGSRDRFYTRRLSDMRGWAHVFEQIVPSPMRSRYGLTVDGRESQHSLDATGPRLFLVIEFDFAPVTPQHKPTIWAPLITACAAKDRGVLDMNAALTAHLRKSGPLWMIVFSAGKSLQSWWPCKGVPEQELATWYRNEACPLGACHSTWCRSQFVRMPDGSRDDGRRQSIEYYDPAILAEKATAPHVTGAVAAKFPSSEQKETSYD